MLKAFGAWALIVVIQGVTIAAMVGVAMGTLTGVLWIGSKLAQIKLRKPQFFKDIKHNIHSKLHKVEKVATAA